jgi:hypothetical protein
MVDLNNEIKVFIDYLKLINDPIKIIDDLKAYDKLFGINKFSNIRENASVIDWNLFTENECEQIFSEIIYGLYEMSEQIDFEVDPIEFEIKQDNPNLNTRRKSMLIYLTKLINIILSQSLTFGLKLNQTRCLDAFILMLKNTSLTERIINSDAKHLIGKWCANLNWLSRTCVETIKKWQSLDAVKTLIKILELNANTPLEITLCQTIVNIASDNELENMKEICNCV